MQFIYTNPQTQFEELIGGHYCINAFGVIEAGDDEKFKNFLATSAPPPRTNIYIDSTGGNVDAAIGIGRLIRDGWFSTSIGTYVLKASDPEAFMIGREHIVGKCISAATLVYLGGRLRHFPAASKFGVHQFSFKDPSPDDLARSQFLSAKIARYISDMEVDPEFLEVSSTTLKNEINLIPIDQLERLNVVTGGVTDVEWSLQARNGMLYVRGERDSIFGHHKVMLAYVQGVGFLFWGVIESQGREDELTALGLVEIVLNGEDIQIDISDRCSREVFGNYVNVLAEISQDEARSIAFSQSFGVRIRFSQEAPMFLGIAAMSTNGGSEQLETMFNILSEQDNSIAEPN